MNFDQLIDENYKGFGTSSHLDLVDLKMMYYGRHGVFVSFTDDGEYSYETGSTEMDRPDGIICYQVNDVIAKKVKSPMFYYNIFRWTGKGVISDIKNYTRDDFYRDIQKLKEMNFDEDILDFYIEEVEKDLQIRYYFERLWVLTENIARTNRNFTKEWRRILMDLGYNQISDPSGTGIISIGKDPVNLILDHEIKLDIDILPAQLHREDPRRHVKERIDKKLRLLRNRRNRIAKQDPVRGSEKMSFADQLKQAAKAFGGFEI